MTATLSAAKTLLATVQDDGTLQIPGEVLEVLGIGPGADVAIMSFRPGILEIRPALKPLPFEEWLERFRIDRPVDYEAVREAVFEDMANDALRELER